MYLHILEFILLTYDFLYKVEFIQNKNDATCNFPHEHKETSVVVISSGGWASIANCCKYSCFWVISPAWCLAETEALGSLAPAGSWPAAVSYLETSCSSLVSMDMSYTDSAWWFLRPEQRLSTDLLLFFPLCSRYGEWDTVLKLKDHHTSVRL